MSKSARTDLNQRVCNGCNDKIQHSNQNPEHSLRCRLNTQKILRRCLRSSIPIMKYVNTIEKLIITHRPTLYLIRLILATIKNDFPIPSKHFVPFTFASTKKIRWNNVNIHSQSIPSMWTCTVCETKKIWIIELFRKPVFSFVFRLNKNKRWTANLIDETRRWREEKNRKNEKPEETKLCASCRIRSLAMHNYKRTRSLNAYVCVCMCEAARLMLFRTYYDFSFSLSRGDAAG